VRSVTSVLPNDPIQTGLFSKRDLRKVRLPAVGVQSVTSLLQNDATRTGLVWKRDQEIYARDLRKVCPATMGFDKRSNEAS